MVEVVHKGARTSEVHNSNQCPKCSNHAVAGIRPRSFYVRSTNKRSRFVAESNVSVMRSLFCKDCKTIFIDPAELSTKIVKGLLSNAIHLVHGPSSFVDFFPKKSRENSFKV